MEIKHLLGVLMVAMGCMGCGGSDSDAPGKPDTPDTPDEPQTPTEEVTFAKGADISWVTEMEAEGAKFYDSEGQETDCFALMKKLGLTAIRLRVWVDPAEHGNYCNQADVVAKAKRAKAEGLDVMIDFHYSDWWADPEQQFKPAAWKGLGLVDLKQALANHTKEVLQALKDAGVEPKWVQVGNEIRPGMLWDEDKALSGASWDIRENEVKGSNTSSTAVKYPMNWANLGAFVATGYDAVKAVFPQAIVIVHVDNGYDSELFKWFFDELKKNGGKWDMIGMSLYPYWAMLYNSLSAEKTITDCIANIKLVASRYDCDVMVVETGMQCANNGKLASATVLAEGKSQLTKILQQCKDNTNGRCKGVFYWEPECKPSSGYALGAFTEDGRPTVIMDAFK